MPPDDSRILDIVLASREIAAYIAGRTFDEYRATSLLRAGVERQVYIIGEAVRQLSEEFKDKHPSIPWTKIVGARNILAHEYGRIDHRVMWEVATIHTPGLAAYLRPYAPPGGDE
jgi:uncharacterized protein with HEPN domain